MRGQANVVAMTMIIAIAAAAAAAYYVYSQGLFSQATQTSAALLDAKIKVERFIEPQGGRIFPETNTVSEFVVNIYNSGDVSIPYSFSNEPIRWYLYNGGVLVAHGASASFGGVCASTIPAGTICTYTGYAPLPEQNYSNPYLVLYVNEYPIRIPLQPVPFPGVKPFYISCSSCSDCTAKISAAAESNTPTLVFIPSVSASGDCIDVNGKSNIILACLGTISGDGSGVGIRIANSTNISVRNCAVTGFATGVEIYDSNNISFSSVKSTDNSVDFKIAGDLSKSCRQGDWDVLTTNGKLLLVQGSAPDTSEQDVGQVSAMWLMGASDYWLSAADASSPGGKVDPLILVCDSNNVHVSAYRGEDSPTGIYLYHDRSTQLDTLSVSSVSRGIVSIDSNASSMYDVSIGFSGDSIFLNPESFEWAAGVTFHG